MEITDRFVISPDVKLIEVTALPEWIRAQFEYEPGDYALTRQHSRLTSQIIDSQAARLFQEFQSPTTIPEAVFAFSRLADLEPQACLQDAFPWLQQAIQAQFLVSADSPQAEVSHPNYSVGDQIGAYRVTRQIQWFDDSEVYEAVNASGRNVALKLIRTRQIMGNFERELNALRQLDGSINPPLIEQGEIDGKPYLVVEWCRGVDILTAARQYRELGYEEGQHKLLTLSYQLLRAYTHLHAQGVLHGDIHPRNVLVDENGQIKLIDFGLAQILASANPDSVFRAGVPSFFEPEYARAILHNSALPPSSIAGEVFALGALVYVILTGTPYTNFSLEHDVMLKQIIEDEPLSFSQRGLPASSEAEFLLKRALSKEPGDRFASVGAFAEAFGGLLAGSKPQLMTPLSLLPQLERDVLARLSFDGEWGANGLQTAPLASVNYGAAGIAYACYRMACAKNDAELLALALHWITYARQEMAHVDAFYNPSMDLTPEVISRVSPYHTASGVHAVSAYIAHALGDISGVQYAIGNFVASAQASCKNFDLTLGRSGVLLTTGLLLDVARTLPAIDVAPLIAFGNELAESIWSAANRYQPIGVGNPISYLGIAHGWAGMVYAALRWAQASTWSLPYSIEQRLSELAALAEPIGRGARWAWNLEHPGNSMPGWCNGSAGHVHLWTLAHEMLEQPQYLQLAQKAAWNTFDFRGASANLCCGLAGQAYALLNLYRATGDKEWLSRGRSLAEMAGAAILELKKQPLDTATALDLRPEGLYKGEVGIALLAAEIEQPELAAMPLFERIHWS